MKKKFQKHLKRFTRDALLILRGQMLAAMAREKNNLRRAMYKTRLDLIDAEFSTRDAEAQS